MTDKEIVQALHICGEGHPCRDCQLYGKEISCVETLCKYALALIERLTAENAKAEAERDTLREKVPQWISVEDRLPEDHLKRYLIAFKDAGGSIVDAARYIPGLGWECYNWDVPQKLITHWMPLPEAPEAHNGKENS